jgi:glycosyltransferase involved in cell wall biosynthesis
VPPRRPPFGSEPQGRRPGGSIRILSFHSPQGKWAALRAGFKAAQGQIIITSDSDLQDNPKEVIKLLRLAIPIRDRHSYDLVSGARINRFDPLYKVIISKAGNLLASFLTGYRFHDLSSPFKIYKREVLENIPQEGSLLRFSTLFARKLGYKVAEVPIIHRPRLYGKSKFGVVKYLRIIYDLILILLLFSGSGKIRNRIKIKK